MWNSTKVISLKSKELPQIRFVYLFFLIIVLRLKYDHNHLVIFYNMIWIQADVDVIFTFSSLDKAELYDKKWGKFSLENLAKSICGIKGATVQGGLGPFGLVTLASSKLEEYTPVFFRIFKTVDNKHKVLLCSDATP